MSIYLPHLPIIPLFNNTSLGYFSSQCPQFYHSSYAYYHPYLGLSSMVRNAQLVFSLMLTQLH